MRKAPSARLALQVDGAGEPGLTGKPLEKARQQSSLQLPSDAFISASEAHCRSDFQNIRQSICVVLTLGVSAICYSSNREQMQQLFTKVGEKRTLIFI